MLLVSENINGKDKSFFINFDFHSVRRIAMLDDIAMGNLSRPY